MSIVAICPSCQSKLRASENMGGHSVKCPKCGATVLLRTHVTPKPPTQQPVPQPAEPEGPPPLPAKPATVANAVVVPAWSSTQTARVAPQVEDESQGLSRTTLIAMWSFVGVFTLVCVAFLVWHLHSSQQAKTAAANARLSQAVAAANEWIAGESLVDGAAVEQALTDALADATEKQVGAFVLNQVRERRAELAEQARIKAAQLEVTAVFQDAKKRIASKQVTEAIGLLRKYVANALATEKVEAERLLAEAETAVADVLTLDALVAMNDGAFDQAKAAGTIDDGKVTNPALVAVRVATVERNLAQAASRRAEAKARLAERQEAERLAAVERQRQAKEKERLAAVERQRQAEEQERAKEAARVRELHTVNYTPKVGAVYVVKDGILAATNFLYVRELDKAIAASDKEGLHKMVRDGDVASLKEGVVLRILEVHERNFLTPQPFVECTAVMGGKSVGKAYVFVFYLSSKFMTPKE